MEDYVESCRNIESVLKLRGWQFIREMTQSVITIPSSDIDVECFYIKDVVDNIFGAHVSKGGVLDRDLSKVVCRRTGEYTVLEDLPMSHDMIKFDDYDDSREKDPERYFLITEVARQIVRPGIL